MMWNVRALQLGPEDDSEIFQSVPEVSWHYEPQGLLEETDEYDVALVSRRLTPEECRCLNRLVRAHCLFILAGVELTPDMEKLMESRAGRRIGRAEVRSFLESRIRNFYGRPYGEKFDPHAISVSRDFKGSVQWNGYTEMLLHGEFGSEMRQIVCWRNSIPVKAGQAIDLWLEYQKSPDVHIEMDVILFRPGSVAGMQTRWRFTEAELQEQVYIDNTMESGPIFITLNACGSGELRLVALHDRYSRRGEGTFFPGSDRIVTEDREEVFGYFDPGDLKPPLCVYFSGYKTQEGFEGYRMMRQMGCPFLLISDSRLEGGAFYLGSRAYEEAVKGLIEKYLEKLHFGREDLVLSGLSMGTFGALYYGTMLRPKKIIVGKPLASLGDMAEAERLERPGGFPTSLDVVWKNCQALNENAISSMNARFWDRFDQADWSDTAFIVAYMIEDDYDKTGYEKLLSHIESTGSRIIGKGLHGRHNDDTAGIVRWFLSQYHRILTQDYGRDGS